jgi:proton glutamate symport protein
MTANTRVLLSLGAGLAAGAVLARVDPGIAATLSDAIAPLGTLWVNALLMTVMPLVLASLGVAVAGAADARVIGRLGRRAALLFVAVVAAVALVAVLVVPPVMARVHVDPAAAASLRASVSAPAGAPAQLETAAQWLTSLLPANPVRAAAEGRLLPLVIYALLFALALTRLSRARAAPVVDLCAGIVEGLRVLVGWVLVAAPVGVFALALPLAVRFGAAAAGLLGFYVLFVAVQCVVLTLALYPVARIAGGIPLARFARAAAPAQTVGFVSRSSVASLPAQMDFARELGLPPAVPAFVLPLAVSMFKCAAPVTFVTGAFFLARLYGVAIAPAQLPFAFVQAALLSFAVPGIPAGSVVTMAPVLAALGVPAEGLGLLMAVDVMADMFRTGANVTGDLTVAVVAARGEIAAS